MSEPLALVALNLGGPGSLDDVQEFLRNLFADPDVIQLGPARPLQPLLARLIARRRAPFSREAYRQIGGASPIAAESASQAAAVAAEMSRRGPPARPYVAMACWHPNSDEAVERIRADGVRRVVALPLYPHYSRATTGSSLRQLERAAAGTDLEIAAVDRYPAAAGLIAAMGDRIEEALASIPSPERDSAPVLFSAHGLPESYIRRGDPYLDDVRVTLHAVARRLGLDGRATLCFQSRVGPQRWLGPTTEETIDRVASSGARSMVVCPLSFTGEHVETLQEIDILYRGRAEALGVEHFRRSRTVGTHPAFVSSLADLALEAAGAKGWLS